MIIILLVNLLSACGENQPDIKWNYSKNEIICKDLVSIEKLNVDIYLDVTLSMGGFASSNTTNYSKLIEDLQATCQDVWKKGEIKFFKFGKVVEDMKGTDLISARTSPVIYTSAISHETNFDEAIKKTDPKKVSIIITDLFYNENEVNRMKEALKTYCIQRGVEVGLIGLKSNFNGVVGDVQPPVTIKVPRPFYVVIMGDKSNINMFFKTLKNKGYINPNQFYLITNKPAEDFNVNIVKDKTCKSLNKQSLKKELEDFGTVFNFRMKKEEKNASFNFEANITPNQYFFPYTDKNLKIDFYKKSRIQKDSSLTNEITIKNLKIVGNKITGSIDLTNTDPEGKFSYLGYITFDNTVTPSMPAWITQYNADDVAEFRQNVDKTLHLSKLLTELTTSNITYNQPKLAKFYINIEKQ